MPIVWWARSGRDADRIEIVAGEQRHPVAQPVRSRRRRSDGPCCRGRASSVSQSAASTTSCRVSCGSSISLACVPQPIQPIRRGLMRSSRRRPGPRRDRRSRRRGSHPRPSVARAIGRGAPWPLIVAAERLQCDRACVADVAERLRHRAPVDMWPEPTKPRSFSFAWKCTMRRPARRIAAAISLSSMFMWNVSSITPTASTSVISASASAWSVLLAMSVSKRFSGSMPRSTPLSAARRPLLQADHDLVDAALRSASGTGAGRGRQRRAARHRAARRRLQRPARPRCRRSSRDRRRRPSPQPGPRWRGPASGSRGPPARRRAVVGEHGLRLGQVELARLRHQQLDEIAAGLLHAPERIEMLAAEGPA